MRWKFLVMFVLSLVVSIPVAHAYQLQGPDVLPPLVSDVNFTYQQDKTILTWKTDEPATSFVAYGDSSAVPLVVGSSNYSTVHMVEFSQPAGTKVFYEIRSCDAANNCASPGVDWFVTGTLFIDADIPKYLLSSVFDVTAYSRAGADVSLYLNNQLARRDFADSTGTVTFSSLSVPYSANITLKASLNAETVQKKYSVIVDDAPPQISVIAPDFTITSPAIVNISVNEPVSLVVDYSKKGSPPEKVSGLTATEIKQSKVLLEWDAVDDALEYLIYRDNVPIGLRSDTKFSDVMVSPDKTYEYQVAAVSTSCVDGTKSNILTVQMPSGNPLSDDVSSVSKSCMIPQTFVNLSKGSHDVPVTLDPGINSVSFTATDVAGRSSKKVVEINYDTTPPKFLDTNLADIQVSYDNDITVKGTLSEPGAITVFINNKAVETVSTNGAFSIPVTLERKSSGKVNASQSSFDTGFGWVNNVRLVGTDVSGRSVETSADVTYSLCGEGTWFDVEVSDPLPGVLTPRLLLEGLQQIGFSFDYKYRGGADRVSINPNDISVEVVTLSPAFADEFDNDKIARINTFSPVQRITDTVEGSGYAQLELAPFDPLDDPDATTYDREKAISDHRRGGLTGVGLLGHMNYYLIITMPFTETNVVTQYDPDIQQTVSREESTNRVQKKCVKFEVMIDERVPPDILQGESLEVVSDLLGNVIDIVDSVFDPVKTIGEYLFYFCIGGTILMYVPTVNEKLACEFSSFAGALGGKGFSVDVASAGACQEVYAGSASYDTCKACEDSKQTREDWRRTYQEVCDRVMCPSPPTLQNYINDKANDPVKEIAPGVFSGSDCSLFAQQNPNPTTHSSIEKVFNDYQKHADDDGSGLNDCKNLHPANPECCGYEYMTEWGSACGSTALGLDTFSEIEESTCLSAQKVGINQLTVPGRSPLSCGRTFNSVSGLCSAHGTRPIEPIKVVAFSDDNVQRLGLDDFGKEKFMYLFVIPKENAPDQFDIKLGYLVELLEFRRSNESNAIAYSERHYFNADLQAIDLPVDVQQFFTKNNLEIYHSNPDRLNNLYGQFANTLSNAAGNKVSVDMSRRIFGNVVGVISTPDQQYIVRPDSDIINAFRCLCFPAMIEYLRLVKSIMSEIKNCIDTVLVTGDGSPGMCQALLSRYVCDLFYSAISCFVDAFGGAPTGRLSLDGPDIFGALTSAGSELGRNVESRYGKSSMYEAIFKNDALMNSVCMFAFTGDFDFDFGAAFEYGLEDVPVESVAALAPCTRRFLGPSLTTNRGLANWVYHFGVGLFPGSDVDVSMKLKCSSGYKCLESDGFVDGECDCNRIGEKVVQIRPSELPTSISKDDPALNTEIYYTLMGSPSDGSVRYDTAILEYTWTNNDGQRQTESAECRITQTGSVPEICSFNVLSGRFECAIGNQPASFSIKDVSVGGSHNLPQPTYALGERLNVSLLIEQEFPVDPQQKHTKYLAYQIFNQNGNIVPDGDTTQNPFALRTNGQYKLKLEDFAIDNDIVVDNSWFGAGGLRNYNLYTWNSNNPSAVSPGNDFIDNVQLFDPNGGLFSGTQYVVLELKEDNGLKYSLKKGLQNHPTSSDGFQGDYVLNAESLNVPNNNVIDFPYQSNVQTARASQLLDARVVIELTQRPVLATGETIQIFIDYNSRTSNPCNDPVARLRPQQFRIKFTGYDSDDYGKPIDQIAIDYNGVPAVKEATFYAACAPAGDLVTVEQVPDTSLSELNIWVIDLINFNNVFYNTVKRFNELDDNDIILSGRTSFLRGVGGSLSRLRIKQNSLKSMIRGLNATMLVKSRALDSSINQTLQSIQVLPIPTTAHGWRNNYCIPAMNTISELNDTANELKDLLNLELGIRDRCPEPKSNGDAYVCNNQQDFNDRVSNHSFFVDVSNEYQCSGGETCYKLPQNRICEGTQGGSNYSCKVRCESDPNEFLDTSKSCVANNLVCCREDSSNQSTQQSTQQGSQSTLYTAQTGYPVLISFLSDFYEDLGAYPEIYTFVVHYVDADLDAFQHTHFINELNYVQTAVSDSFTEFRRILNAFNTADQNALRSIGAFEFLNNLESLKTSIDTLKNDYSNLASRANWIAAAIRQQALADFRNHLSDIDRNLAPVYTSGQDFAGELQPSQGIFYINGRNNLIVNFPHKNLVFDFYYVGNVTSVNLEFWKNGMKITDGKIESTVGWFHNEYLYSYAKSKATDFLTPGEYTVRMRYGPASFEEATLTINEPENDGEIYVKNTNSNSYLQTITVPSDSAAININGTFARSDHRYDADFCLFNINQNFKLCKNLLRYNPVEAKYITQYDPDTGAIGVVSTMGDNEYSSNIFYLGELSNASRSGFSSMSTGGFIDKIPPGSYVGQIEDYYGNVVSSNYVNLVVR